MRTRRWVSGLFLAGVVWAAWPARGQGIPTWAPRVVDVPDAGPNLARGVVHVDRAFRDDGGRGKADAQWKQAAEFILGFDPLEKAIPQTPARPDAGGPPATIATDAGSTPDGGS